MASIEQCEDLNWVLEAQSNAQEADSDNRERAKEAKLFIHQRGGQWEQQWYSANEGKPRYSFDIVEPVIDQIAGDMEESSFDARVSPSGAGASEEYAETYDGLLRDIHNSSNAKDIFDRAGRVVVECGVDFWRVVQEYASGESFDQELRIKKIPNATERVWLGPHEEPDGSDAEYGWVLTGMTKDAFERKFPGKNAQSVDQNRTSSAFYHRNELVMVGEFLYLKPVEIELVKMSDERVFRDDDDFKAMKDELAAAGITEVARRKTEKQVVYSRLFSSGDWLTDPRETVFEEWLPLIPCYANFEVIEDKIIYRGAVEKLMDPQRTFNYSLSREIEEGALAPRAKYWMTKQQAKGYEDTLSTLNTNSDPVQFFNPDERVNGGMPPQQAGGAQINQGLRSISETMRQVVSMSAGMFAANMGDTQSFAQSGVAIERLQDRGDTGANKYTSARKRSQRQTARILMKAIPRVYAPGRQIRLLKEDNSNEVVTIGQRVMDEETGSVKVLHDLSVGAYDVKIIVGPSYESKQNETVDAITKVGQVDPSIVEMGSDVLLGNIPSPGMDDLAARKRRQLFLAGAIPPEQMTEREKQEMQAMQNQPQQPSPEMVLAQAEDKKAQADLMDKQIKMLQTQNRSAFDNQQIQIKQFEAVTKRMQAQIERLVAMVNAENTGADTAVKRATAQGKELENAMGAGQALNVTEPEPMDVEPPQSGLEMILVGSDLEALQ